MARHRHFEDHEDFGKDYKGPLIITLPDDDRFIVWDHVIENWIVKRVIPGGRVETIVEEEVEFRLLAECWCGAKRWCFEDIHPSYLEKEYLDQFRRQHALCGKKKNKSIHSENLIYNITEEEEKS